MLFQFPLIFIFTYDLLTYDQSSFLLSFILSYLLQSVSQTYNWSDFSHLVIRMRGDGRTYGLGLQTNYKRSHHLDFTMGLTANDQFHYPMFTRGGPYWQTVKVPSQMDYLSRLLFLYKEHFWGCSTTRIKLQGSIFKSSHEILF